MKNFFFYLILINFQFTQQQYFQKELNYLEYYLGIKPANENGEFCVKKQLMDKYIDISSHLNCDFSTNCLWENAPSDGLLDNSDFYLFKKINDQSFPLQVGPGNSHPKIGTYFAFAGNSTKEPNYATLISAPISCQITTGILSFEYWLYNNARIEVIILRVNPTHGHLTVIERPLIDCHFFKPNGICQVEIRQQSQPFRLALRAIKLNDPIIFSFILLNKIKYEAALCGFYINHQYLMLYKQLDGYIKENQ
ncbi:hypothetical protein Mgra_00006255 [Meloidogyne graminicola]|uniref:MAM domain-containing protein n=1 Tax=Meloidogyne graminicola TaxID=189291 RepID=A0A8S9ZLQ1_9BILA|nr:hypothetical protein Mgra_00006255 [Meloidogyne graminicola]